MNFLSPGINAQEMFQTVYEFRFEKVSPIPWKPDVRWPIQELYIDLKIAEVNQKKPFESSHVEDETWLVY